MRFSAVFDAHIPLRTTQGEERPAQGVPANAPQAPAVPVPNQVPEDLDQRVREVGEWQLEDW